jgi:(1->4)-alpha-D-glucan 1-alpha-D-glucosylmutase
MHIPNQTYRIQLNHQCTFARVAALIPYFKKLGITDLYFPPILQAQPGSLHGYDAIDYAQVNTELGGIEGLNNLSQLLKKSKINLCVDIVPNHMAATKYNAYWQNVLKEGSSAKYRYLFDIKWENSSAKHLVYRRFFDINDLVCLNAEQEEVFKDTHQLLLKLIKKGIINGLRIDHIDGLRKPEGYLKRLHTVIGQPFYIIAEKILGFDEKIPNWQLLGTTGYDYLNHLNQLFINEEGLKNLNQIYNTVTQNKKSIFEIKYDSLTYVILNLFADEFNSLCEKLQEILEGPLSDVRAMLLQCSALMPVYRLYQDEAAIKYNEYVIEEMFSQINIDNKRLCAEFKNLLLNKLGDQEYKKKLWELWRSNWEVFSGPVMAKGFEDTTCYNYYSLCSVNEVGSCPQNFISAGQLTQFHEYVGYRQQHFPYSLNTTSTHDTKRSEDIRARLNVLSELSDEWGNLLNQWMQNNKIKKAYINEDQAPDRVDETLIYQTLLSAWPLNLNDNDFSDFKLRIKNYLNKALRERKQHSSWSNPNEPYEVASYNFVESLLTDTSFMNTFLAFQHKIEFYGMYNSLSQLVLKLCTPGIPDIYQGNESWRYDLVDPDNRRIIDYEYLQTLNSDLPLAGLLKTWQDGRIKFNVTRRILSLRNQYKQLFIKGDYLPLQISGASKEHVIAFVRQYKNEWLVVITCRWFSHLILPGAEWSSAQFLNEACTVPGRSISLLDNKLFNLQGSDLLIGDVLKDLPFNILKNY